MTATSPISVYDRVVLGAGLFGLYATTFWSKRGVKVAVIDADVAPMLRASYINQARLHYGYHYPRSLTTARSSIEYYHRFRSDFEGAINSRFQKIYAISTTQSFMSSQGFERFCDIADIPRVEVDPARWFKANVVAAAYLTDECSFDANRIRETFLRRLDERNVTWYLGRRLRSAATDRDRYELVLDDGSKLRTRGVLNATYSGLNQVLGKFDFAPFPLEYQLCEIILADVDGVLGEVGITVMDGDYFSLMPFGRTGCYSLTTVDYTPRLVSNDSAIPVFPCQLRNPNCNMQSLDNCTYCVAHPDSSWPYAFQRASVYLRESQHIRYRESLYTVKVILRQSHVDDSRPTLIEVHSEKPWLCSVLSGKVATMYDLDTVL
jgi:glycine/D-amino acid oxidase-like deaminating enzyme